MAVISGTDYLTIATELAAARTEMQATVAHFLTCATTIVNEDVIAPNIDLLPEFYNSYLANKARLEATSGFEASVRALQQHVQKESTEGDVVEYILAHVAGGVPAGFAELSKIVGFDIDAVINTTMSSSSSS